MNNIEKDTRVWFVFSECVVDPELSRGSIYVDGAGVGITMTQKSFRHLLSVGKLHSDTVAKQRFRILDLTKN